jgi:DNA-binding NtrC family response regulator
MNAMPDDAPAPDALPDDGYRELLLALGSAVRPFMCAGTNRTRVTSRVAALALALLEGRLGQSVNEWRRSNGLDLDTKLEEYERFVIISALERTEGNVVQATKLLGYGSRQSLYKSLRRLRIDHTVYLP